MPHELTRWTGKGGDTAWTDAGNWKGGVPAAGIDAVFADGGAWTVHLLHRGAPLPAGALIVHGDALTLDHGGLDLAPRPATNGNTFDMVLDQGARVTIAPDAVVRGSQVALIGANGSTATLDVYGLVREAYGIVQGGTLDIAAGGHWRGGDSGVDVAGGGTLTVQSGGTLDGGPATYQVDTSSLQIDDGSATVSGAGSLVRESALYLGEFGGTARLLISDGGVVKDLVGVAGGAGDGLVTVTGAGSRWVNHDALTIGGEPPVGSSLTITDHGAVTFGEELILRGTLSLDATAQLAGGTIISDGGLIATRPDAHAGAGVTIASALYVTDNPYDPIEIHTTYLEAQGGATLTLGGRITGSSDGVLDAASGHIVLAGTGNTQAATQLYASTLELAANGAAGSGMVSFVGGEHAASLVLDAGVDLGNAIAGFGPADRIDLAGLSYGADIMAQWSSNGDGGTLDLSSAGRQVALLFTGQLSLGSFAFAADGHGGTDVLHS